ncbi:MAG TPA: aldehyde dehydrogenase family protein [Pseudonocardiaceae bacterium]
MGTWTSEEVRRVFGAQRASRWTRKRSTADERRERLLRLRHAVLRYADDVARALNADLRRPLDGPVPSEVRVVVKDIDDALAHLEEWMAPTEVPSSFAGTTAHIQYEARGIVLLFGPWNFPFSLVFQPLVAIIAAGNTAIVKPNELSPATAAVTLKLIKETFSDDEVAVFQGGVDLAVCLLDLPVDHIFFTGSPAVAHTVMAAAARHLASVTLELGGKCPAIIDGTTDLATVAALVCGGKLSNAGQICLSPDHVYIRSDIRDEFIEQYMRQVEASVYADGTINLDAMPRIVNERNFDRVSGYIEDALERGAKLIGTGGRDRATLTIEPAVLIDVPPDAVVMAEEIFGPVLPVVGYEDLVEVLEAVRGRPKPLAVYVYTDDPEAQAAILAGTSSGGVTINGWATHCADPQLPFGGVGNSGMGAYHGVYGFRELSHARAVARHATG